MYMQGNFSNTALEHYQEVAWGKLVDSLYGSSYDFTRCVRPNGTAYGTAGTCRKGVEAALEAEPAPEITKKPRSKAPSKALLKSLPVELRARAEKLVAAYEELAELKGQNLPSGENWRIDEANKKVGNALKDAFEMADTMRLRPKMEAIEWLGFASSRTQTELRDTINRNSYDLRTLREYNPEKKDELKALERKTLTLVDNVKDPVAKAQLLFETSKASGKLKVSKAGSLTDTLRKGNVFLREYDEGLRSTVSILRKANALEKQLRELSEKLEVDREPGWIKKKLRVSGAIMKAARHRGDAEARLQAKMQGIREQLLKTSLSEEKVQLLVSRVALMPPKGSITLDQETVAQTRKHLEEFTRMFNGRGMLEVLEKKEERKQLSQLVIDPAQRAFAMVNNTGFVTSDGGKQTLFHEIGHIVEVQRDWLLKYSNRWRDSRAFSIQKAYDHPETQKLVGDGKTTKVPYTLETLSTTRKTVPVVKLNEMLPHVGMNYKPEEIAVLDTFLSPYLGKRYKDNFTEIVSSTLEHFAEPHLMAHLYKRHPDLFTLGVGLATD
jgi:hypothetical protein